MAKNVQVSVYPVLRKRGGRVVGSERTSALAMEYHAIAAL